jgi:hypothetical protein
MKSRPFSALPLCALIFAATALWVDSAGADTTRSQTISLRRGWNAVFLQVTPANLDPNVVFSNMPVSIVATYLTVDKSIQYIKNPGEAQWNKDGWGVWYSARRPDGFLSSLRAINGNRAYLILAQQDCVWNVTGEVTFEKTRWKSDSFNLVGFSVDDSAPPTFDQFFSGSNSHQPCRIYRLNGDQWTLVNNPVQATMRSGEACWVYCAGSSEYQGPLQIQLLHARDVTFGSTGEASLAMVNQSTDPMNIRVDTVASDIGVPLAYTVTGITPGAMALSSYDLPATYNMQQLDPGQKTALWLKLRRERMTSAAQSALLKITSDNGVQIWIPVKGDRADLATQ